MKSLHGAFIALLLVLAAHPAVAQITGPVYPPPGATGGVTSSSGSPINTGGKTVTYGNFDTSAYGQLWWGEVSINNVCSGACSTPGLMSFSNYDSGTGIATWLSTNNWDFTSGTNGPISVQTEFVLQLASGTALVNPTGFPGNPALVVPVTGDFTVNFEYEVAGTSVNSYFQGLNGGLSSGFNTSNTAGFFSTPPTDPTPEPASFLYMGTGLLAMGGVLRRRISNR
jgi:hypothetical protein